MSTITSGTKVKIINVEGHYYAVPRDADIKIIRDAELVSDLIEVRVGPQIPRSLYNGLPKYPVDDCFLVCKGGHATTRIARVSNIMLQELASTKPIKSILKPANQEAKEAMDYRHPVIVESPQPDEGVIKKAKDIIKKFFS